MVGTLTRSAVTTQSKKGDGPLDPPPEESAKKRSQYKNEIVILVSAPLVDKDLSPIEGLSIQKEIDEIFSVVEDIEANVAIEIIVKIATTESLLQIFAKASRPNIIHFIGHGMQTDQGIALLLEDAVGKARPFTSQDLNTLLAERPYPPCELVLLNACHSEGLANSLVTAGVPHIIAVNAEDTILDTAARSFSKHFYQALFNEYSIIDAFYQSRNALQVNDELATLFNTQTFQQGINLEESLKFHLLPRNSQAHHHHLKLETGHQKAVIAPSWQNTNLPDHDANFIGRRLAIYDLVKDLAHYSRGHCIALHGMGGMGKTALALAVGRWQHERGLWRDGVWFIKLRGISSVAKAVSEISVTLSLDSINTDSEHLSQALRNKNILLILDDLDKLLESNTDELVELIDALLKCRRLGLLVTARSNLPFSEISVQSKEVKAMEPSETRQAFSNYAPPQEQWGIDTLSQEDFDALFEFFDGYPFAVRLAATHMKETRCNLGRLCGALKVAACKTLKPISRKESRENSLKATLDISYQILPPGGREIFSLLSFFPGGLTKDLASFIKGRDCFVDLSILLAFSMAEKPEADYSDEYRVTLPEPARRYAEGKQEQGIESYAPKILQYFYEFSQKVYDLLEQEDNKGKQLLLAENTNLHFFLAWGYEHELNQTNVCYSARITALLAKYWHWVSPGDTPLLSLEKAFANANRHQDIICCADIKKAIGDIHLLDQGLEVARETYQQSITLYESAFENSTIALENASIREKVGEIWNICQQSDLALSSYLEAYHIYLSEEYFLRAAKIQITIGHIHTSVNHIEEALENYNIAQQLYTDQNYQPGIARVTPLIQQLISRKTLVPFSFRTSTVDDQGSTVQEKVHSSEYFTEFLSNQTSIEMVAISGGAFAMGSPPTEPERFDTEGPCHSVAVPSFLMGRYPITQAQWRFVAGLQQIEIKLEPAPSRFKGDDHPVESVSWYEAVEFCKRLAAYTERPYRLPSEAEWEYACRAGTTTPFAFGPTLTTTIASYNSHYSYNNGPKGAVRIATTPVDEFGIANAFGLCNMHGNVWEWCADHWHTNYNGAPGDGSAWLTENESEYRVVRGGSWDYYPRDCRSASRFDIRPDNRYDSTSFRVCCRALRTL